MNPEQADLLIKKYSLHEKDTGSTMVQIIALSVEIQKIIEHRKRQRKKLEPNRKQKKERWKDVPARRAMLEKIAKREKFWKYLQKNNLTIYENLKKEFENFEPKGKKLVIS